MLKIVEDICVDIDDDIRDFGDGAGSGLGVREGVWMMVVGKIPI